MPERGIGRITFKLHWPSGYSLGQVNWQTIWGVGWWILKGVMKKLVLINICSIILADPELGGTGFPSEVRLQAVGVLRVKYGKHEGTTVLSDYT